MTFRWILLAISCIACWGFVALATFRIGYYGLFWIGFILSTLVDHRGIRSPDRTSCRGDTGARSRKQHRKRTTPKKRTWAFNLGW